MAKDYSPLTPAGLEVPWEYTCHWVRQERSYVVDLSYERRLWLVLGVRVNTVKKATLWSDREVGWLHLCVDELWPRENKFTRTVHDDLVMPIIRVAEPVLDNFATLWGLAHNVDVSKYKGLAETYGNFLREGKK